MTPALALTAIVLAALLGLAVSRARYRPRFTSVDLSTLQSQYETARRQHKPSEAIRKQMVRAKTEQIRKEIGE